MSAPLAGITVAVAEGRQIEELAALLEKEGATVDRRPMLSILDAPDPAPVLAWLDELIADRFSHLVLMTGEGLRRLLGFAERAGRREDVVAALARLSTLTRGPKPMRAMKEIGLTPTLVSDAPTTDGVIATLSREELQGRTVGVQLYSPDPSALVPYLESRGAVPRCVLPYVYASASHAGQVVELIEHLADGRAQVLVITSSPQVDRLFETATEHGLEEKLRAGLSRACVAAVGPVAAEGLRRRGVEVHVCPEQGFVMKNLVQHIVRSKRGT